MDSRKAFGKALRMWRLSAGLRQIDVAGYTNQSFIRYLENGQKIASLDKAQELSVAIGMHPLALILTVYALQQKQDLAAVIVELLQDLQGKASPKAPASYNDREETVAALREVGLLTMGLKELAATLNVPASAKKRPVRMAEPNIPPLSGKRVRSRKRYLNPYTGEEVFAGNLANLTLKKWRLLYGDDMVRSWATIVD